MSNKIQYILEKVQIQRLNMNCFILEIKEGHLPPHEDDMPISNGQ